MSARARVKRLEAAVTRRYRDGCAICRTWPNIISSQSRDLWGECGYRCPHCGYGPPPPVVLIVDV